MPGQILVVDPDTKNRIILRSRISLSCHGVLQASSGEEGLGVIAARQPDLVLLGPGFSADAACGLTARIRGADPAGAPPVVILTHDRRREVLHRALCAGAEDVVGGPMQDDYLLALIRGLMRQRGALDELLARNTTERQLGLSETGAGFSRPGAIAMVARNASIARAWCAAIEQRSPHRLSWLVHADALRSVSAGAHPDLFVVEETADRPDDTLRLISELRSRPEARHARLILVADDRPLFGPTAAQRLAMALDLGAHDILRDGFNAEELSLRADVQITRKHHEDRLRNRLRDGLREALRDPLTGLYNRRYAIPHIGRMAERCNSRDQSLAVMMIDVDRFKAINDTHGHQAGDRVLVEIAARLQDNIRSQDLLARIGGEEFLIAMPDTDLAQAERVAGRLCTVVGRRGIHALPDAAPIPVTVSIGLALSTPHHPGLQIGTGTVADMVDSLIGRADSALYGAKASGRNTVTVCGVAAA